MSFSEKEQDYNYEETLGDDPVDVAEFYITMKDSYKNFPSPLLGKNLETFRNTILAYYGPEFLYDIDQDEPHPGEQQMLDSLDGKIPN